MKKTAFLFTVGATVALLAGSPAAKAVSPELGLVTPLSTFSFDVSGFNKAATTGYLLTPDETATFGATTTYAAAGINGQNITIASSESVGVTTTTDTFTVSTPTSFLTTTAVNGTTIAIVDFDLGDANSGGGTVNFTLPISSYSLSAYLLYGTAETNFSYTPANTAATLTNGGMSIAVQEGVNFGSAVSAFAPNVLSLSISYPTLSVVPEPSTWAMCGVGMVGCAGVVFRRRRAA